MGSTPLGGSPLGGCIGYFLKFLFSNFRSHIKDSKWGRKYIFMNYTCCNGSPQKNPISVCKWEIAPFLLQSILGNVIKIQYIEGCSLLVQQ